MAVMRNIETYQDAYNFLFSFEDFSLTRLERIAPERFELGRMFELMRQLGDPHLDYPTIHIAGTKGKGSVAAHCAAALQSAGHRTGLYTSPHLEDFRERIQINGVNISQDDFIDAVNLLKEVATKIPGLTSYELQTTLAFLFFSRREVECAVVEVGLGGRLDSTNILTPLVSVITNISFDHLAILGNTLGKIAREKGGIIKPGVPVVSSPQQSEALLVLKEMAAEKQTEFMLVGEEYSFETLEKTLSGVKFQVSNPGGEKKILMTKLLGDHQVENAVTAYAALQVADGAGVQIPEDAIQAGYASVRWPGRFEVFSGYPIVVLDGAHNRRSAQVLANTIRDYFPDMPITLVFGASEDKDIAGMFAELLPMVEELYLVQAGHPRAASPTQLAQLAADYPLPVHPVMDLETIFEILHTMEGQERVVLVTGSLYLVGHFRGLWLQK